MLPQTKTQSSSCTAPDLGEIRAGLEVILSSPTFLRSERQSQFLRFVCETALKGEGAKLNEYVIAHEVFGRGPNYSPGEDSVVRRQAHSLRQKLQEYYVHEGHDSRIRIDIPSGRYIPVFSRVDQPAASHQVADLLPGPDISAVVSKTRTEASRGAKNLMQVVLASLVCLILGYLIGVSRHQNRAIQPVDSAIAEIWGPWLSDPTGAVICLSNPLTAVVKQFPFALPVDQSRYPPRIVVTPEQSEQFRQFFELPAGGHFYLYPARSQSKMGETIGTASLTAMLTRAGVPIHATQSRFLSWDDFRNENLILVGHDEANRWLDPILARLPMRMVTTEADKERHITVGGQHGKEHDEFYLENAPDLNSVSRDYALVSMVRGVDEKHKLLLINGLNTEGTQIAMEYMCDPRRLRELLTRFHQLGPAHKGAWYFQFILRTEVRDQVPTTADLLTVKIL